MPLTLETLRIIFPYSAAIAAVGLLESLLTAQIVDDKTDTPSDKNRECTGQGIAIFVSGLFGGMAGCAVIVWTHSLALRGGVGVLLSALSFARRVVQVIRVRSEYDSESESRT